MNRWLTRSLWLLALSFWAWLGFGLYRELPRDLGPVIYHLPNATNQLVVGFTDHTFRLVGCFHDWNAAGHELWIWDSERRSLAKKHLASLPTVPWSTSSPARDFGVVPARVSEIGWDRGYAFDLRTGARRALPIQGFSPIFHSQKPWAMFTSLAENPNGPFWVKAFDLRTGQSIFEWQSAARSLKDVPFFIGDDRIGIPLNARENDLASVTTLEVWTLSKGDAPTHRIAPFEIGRDAAASKNGRVAWHQKTSTVQVFDIAAERMVFSEPQDASAAGKRATGGILGTPLLSDDGQAVLAPISGTLFEIDTGRLLWRARDEELIVGYKGQRQFETKEVWSIVLGRWSKSFETFAMRNLRDGDLVYRSWWPTLNQFADDEFDQGFILTEEGVRSLPPRVSYPLLALCQTILALPLVLLCAILRWRRKRRMRMAGAAP
jgi:hypothetical protein